MLAVMAIWAMSFQTAPHRRDCVIASTLYLWSSSRKIKSDGLNHIFRSFLRPAPVYWRASKTDQSSINSRVKTALVVASSSSKPAKKPKYPKPKYSKPKHPKQPHDLTIFASEKTEKVNVEIPQRKGNYEFPPLSLLAQPESNRLGIETEKPATNKTGMTSIFGKH